MTTVPGSRNLLERFAEALAKRPQRLEQADRWGRGGVPAEMSDELRAELKASLVAMRTRTEEAQRRISEEKRQHVAEANAENHDMLLPNIAVMDLKSAKTVFGIVNVQLATKSYVGLNVHGTYGDQKTSSLQTYRSWLEQYITNYGAEDPDEPTTLLNV